MQKKSKRQQTPGPFLYFLVKVHDCNVDQVEAHQDECLVPLHPLVVNYADEDSHGDAVGHAVSGQRPPVQRYHLQ